MNKAEAAKLVQEFVKRRKKAGLSQSQAARSLGMTQSRVSMIECGLRPIPDEWLRPRAPGLRLDLFDGYAK